MDSKFKFLASLAIAAVAICIVLSILATIGAVRITNGCFFRYSQADLQGNGGVHSDSLFNTIILRATGNYKTVNVQSGDQSTVQTIPDPQSYGKWLNTNLSVTDGQVLNVKIKGDISTCRAYVPVNNVQASSNLDKDGALIPIPRIEEGSDPISLIFDASQSSWGNIAEIYPNDKVVVFLTPDHKDQTAQNVVQYDYINKIMQNADCREGKTAYSPICGRYSIYSGQYVNGCGLVNQCTQCSCTSQCVSLTPPYPAIGFIAPGVCMGLIEVVCNWCSCQKETYANAPEPYKFDGTYTNPWSMAVTSLFTDFNPQCSTSISYIQGDYQNRLYFWYSANDAAGLLYRFSSSITPLSPNTLGTDINVAQIATSQGQYADASKYQLIQDLTYNGNSTSYLQYSLFKPDGWTENPTGGYVLSIKQTKCRSSDGIGMGSSYGNKGNVAYIIVPSGEDPNTSGNSYTPNVIQVDNNGLATITIPSGTQNSNVWMIIQNLPSDYQDSFGQYSVSISTNVPTGQFSVQILNPLFSKFKSNVRSTAETLFKNMTCYDGFSSQYFSCTNFFNYIKAMLILYIISYAAMFLLGMVEISQKDLVIRVVKIAIVSGLMSQGTFNLFNTYVFDLATGFSDQMIANMSGYSIFTNLGSIDNPFMFMDALMSKIFFSFTFLGQLLALLSMGISGILYFIIVLVALIILIIAVLRAIVVYIMAFLSVAILIGLAPLFITFMLFEATWYLFDNWVRFTFRYMVEPVVLMAGIIILTQLFTIYLDYVLGYSVCWKCALPFSIPFPSIPGFNPAFLHVDIFCINWFAPWGLDHRSGLMGINMQHMIALAMIAYCMHGYAELSSKMVTNITGATGPAATDTAGKMSRSYEQKALGKVGLDDKSRAQYKAGMKERLKNKEAALKAQDKRIRKEGSARNKSDDKAKGGAKDQVQTKS